MTPFELSEPKSAEAQARAVDWSDKRFAGWLIAACIGVLLVMLVADRPLATAAAHLPDSITGAVAAVTDDLKGAYFILLALVATLALWIGFLAAPAGSSRLFREGTVNAGFVFSAAVTALIAATLLKFLIGRARPELLGIDGPFAFSPFSTAKAMTSFPSGETAMTVAFFGACAWAARARVGPAFAMAIFAPAVLIAASRVVVGAHYPSDVLAAMVLSVAVVGYLYHALQSRRAAISAGLDRQRLKLRGAARAG